MKILLNSLDAQGKKELLFREDSYDDHDYKMVPLQYAAYQGDAETLKELLNVMNEQDKKELIFQESELLSRTTLHLAIAAGDAKTVKILLDALEYKEEVSEINPEFDKVFDSLEDNDKKELLLKEDQNQDTALHLALSKGMFFIIEDEKLRNDILQDSRIDSDDKQMMREHLSAMEISEKERHEIIEEMYPEHQQEDDENGMIAQNSEYRISAAGSDELA